MKFLHYSNVLCLSPHPDDVEYSMAGTILKFWETQFDILCLTEGGDYDLTTRHTRHDEVRSSWGVTNACNVKLSFSDQRMLKDLGTDGWINHIERGYLSMKNYDCIMIPTALDSHFEHIIVSNFGYALIREKPISIIEYYSPSTLETWVPNMFIEVSRVYETKKEMLKKFTSQQHRLYFSDPVIDQFHTHYQQAKRGINKVEKFRLVTTTIK